MATIQGSVSADANLKMGNAFDESLGDSVRVTVIATGFPAARRSRMQPRVLAGRGAGAPE